MATMNIQPHPFVLTNQKTGQNSYVDFISFGFVRKLESTIIEQLSLLSERECRRCVIDTTHISAANMKCVKSSNSLTVNKNMIYETSCLMNVE